MYLDRKAVNSNQTQANLISINRSVSVALHDLLHLLLRGLLRVLLELLAPLGHAPVVGAAQAAAVRAAGGGIQVLPVRAGGPKERNVEVIIFGPLRTEGLIMIGHSP